MLIFKEEFMIYIKNYLAQNNINLKTPEYANLKQTNFNNL